jgi:hypothetical protein
LRRGTGRRYASNIRLLSQRRFRIAYASQTMDSFSSAVGQGLRWAASEHQIDLVEMAIITAQKLPFATLKCSLNNAWTW